MANKPANKTKKILIITGIIILSVILILTATGTFIVYTKNDVIYPNVYIGNVKVGNMTLDEASLKLEENFKNEQYLKFKYNDNEFEIYGKDIDITYNYAETSNNALKKGKSDNFIAKISGALTNTFFKTNIPLNITLSENKLFRQLAKTIPDAIDKSFYTSAKIEGETIAITNGKGGMGVDIKKLSENIKQNISKGKSDVINITIEKCEPIKYTAEMLYEEFHADPVDAVYSLDKENPEYKESQTGIDFDLEKARKILKENENNKETYYIPLIVTMPEKNDNWFIDENGQILGTYTTTYNASVIGRSANIDIAAGKINGLILKPGERFSFNDIVGERTTSNGFKTASVYSGGKVVDGIGGGICQVSSTLFNAVVYADLKIVYRTNHSMPVSYVPNGRDATVSYGEIDFIFENNKPYPVRLDVTSGGGSITCSVKGIKTDDKRIEIVTQTVATVPFSEEIIEDETLPSGTKKIKQAGTLGYHVNTYKVTYIGGEKKDSILLTKSSYRATPQISVIGTKPIDEPSQSGEEVTETIVPTIPEIEMGGEDVTGDIPIEDFENIKDFENIDEIIE